MTELFLEEFNENLILSYKEWSDFFETLKSIKCAGGRTSE